MTLVSLFGRKPESRGGKPSITQQRATLPPAANFAAGEAAPPHATALELDEDLFLPHATRLGAENEAVRNLLMDAEHKIGELETVKRSIAKLVDPVHTTLRGYEEAKSEKLVLQNALNTARDVCNKLRDNLGAVEKRAAAFKTECARLQEIGSTAQQKVALLERSRIEQLAELSAHRAQITELQRLTQQQTAELQLTRDENRKLGDRAAAADQRAVQLEGETRAAQQQARQVNQERAAVQASLDKALAEMTQTARRQSDGEKALAATQARLKAAEANLAELQGERARLAAALDEATHQHRDKMHQLATRLEAVQARSGLSDNLLEEARQALLARAEQVHTFERRLADTVTAHDATAEKLSQAAATLAERDRQIRDLEQARLALSERAQQLVEAASARESAYGEAQQKISEQNGLIEVQQQQLSAARSSNDIQIENLNAQLHRERLDRTMAEGALEAARKDVARLLQEISALRGRPLSKGGETPAALQKAA